MPERRISESAERVSVHGRLLSYHPVMLRDRLMSHQKASALTRKPRLFEHLFYRVGHGQKLLAVRCVYVGECDVRQQRDVDIAEFFNAQRLLCGEWAVYKDVQPGHELLVCGKAQRIVVIPAAHEHLHAKIDCGGQQPAVYFLGVRRWLSLVENVSCDDQSVYPALRRDLPVNAPEYLREQRMFDVRRDVGVIE